MKRIFVTLALALTAGSALAADLPLQGSASAPAAAAAVVDRLLRWLERRRRLGQQQSSILSVSILIGPAGGIR